MSRHRLGAFALSAALVAAAVALAVVAVRGSAPPRTMPDRVRAVASSLRCPICQDLSAADSPSTVAQQMRRTIATDLRAGQTPAQIRATFVRAYGDWILMAPPRRGIDLVAWLAPALLLLAGVALAVRAARRWTLGATRAIGAGASDAEAGGGPPSLGDDDRRLLERALAGPEADAT